MIRRDAIFRKNLIRRPKGIIRKTDEKFSIEVNMYELSILTKNAKELSLSCLQQELKHLEY